MPDRSVRSATNGVSPQIRVHPIETSDEFPHARTGKWDKTCEIIAPKAAKPCRGSRSVVYFSLVLHLIVRLPPREMRVTRLQLERRYRLEARQQRRPRIKNFPLDNRGAMPGDEHATAQTGRLGDHGHQPAAIRQLVR